MSSKRKVLLMGRSGSGKTSMRSIIFANYIPRDTMRLGATLEVEHSNVRFLGNLVLNLWDCGGQDAFMDNYFESQREHIFRQVAVLIYVFDIESPENEKDIRYFTMCCDAIKQSSAAAKVFCLIHKMDLVREGERELTFARRTEEIRQLAAGLSVETFATSIWDDSLYKAWSSIVHALIPDIKVLEKQLQRFCKLTEADEVVLFERSTFLVITAATEKAQQDNHRFEKISTIIKVFKLICNKNHTNFESMEIRNGSYTAFVEHFTQNTFVLVVMSDPQIESAATMVNIQIAKNHFEKMMQARQRTEGGAY